MVVKGLPHYCAVTPVTPMLLTTASLQSKAVRLGLLMVSS